MNQRATTTWSLSVLPAVAALAVGAGFGACSSNTSPATPDGGGMDATPGGDDAGGDALDADTHVDSLRLDPGDVHLAWTLGAAAPSTHLRVLATRGGHEDDVTAMATLRATGGVATVSADGTVTATAAGSGQLAASFGGASAMATVEVDVSGDVVVSGPADAPGRFAAAIDGTDPALSPHIEYPLDGVMLPANLAPIEVQWAAGTAGASEYRVRWVAPHTNVSFYTTAREVLPPADAWRALLQATRGARASLDVTALSTDGSTRATSGALSVEVASDGLAPALIYYWEASSSSLKVIDPTTGTNTLLRGDCSGCHALSRDGRRLAFVREAHIPGQPTYDGLGAMRYDPSAHSWNVTFAPTDAQFVAHTAVFGDWVGFGGESTGHTVMTTAEYDGTLPYRWRLDARDPDTGAEIPSDFASLSTRVRPGSTSYFETPELSADGRTFLFSAGGAPSGGAYVTNPGIYAADVSRDASGTLSTTNLRALVTPPDGSSSELFPHVSPDGSALLGLEVDGPYFVLPSRSRLFLLPDFAHDVRRVVLARASGDPADFPTWPQWAPDMGSVRWVVFSTSRPYGHRGPGPSPCGGYPIPCRQLWISAVDAGTSPSGDPSHAPFWLPAQDVGTHNLGAQWTPPPPPM